MTSISSRLLRDLRSLSKTLVSRVAESDEDKPGVILDYDAARNLVSLEILDVSRRVSFPNQIEYQVAPCAP